MADWNIKVLFYGRSTAPAQQVLSSLGNRSPGEDFTLPYLGFLLQLDNRNVLVDCGINDKFIVDGKAWGGFPAEGGRSYVEQALQKNGVTPEQIEMVIYTHLHNDHAGNCDLFPRAKHIFQKDEWLNLLDPLPVQKARRDYDLDIIPVLAKLDTIKVDGDLEILPGVKLNKAPGHSLGGQLITVETAKGAMVILGDLCSLRCRLFPEIEEIIDLEDRKYALKANVALYGPAIPSNIVYDYFAWYDSVYKAKALAQAKPELVLPGHEPSLVAGSGRG